MGLGVYFLCFLPFFLVVKVSTWLGMEVGLSPEPAARVPLPRAWSPRRAAPGGGGAGAALPRGLCHRHGDDLHGPGDGGHGGGPRIGFHPPQLGGGDNVDPIFSSTPVY